jgi:hypothetical protein
VGIRISALTQVSKEESQGPYAIERNENPSVDLCGFADENSLVEKENARACQAWTKDGQKLKYPNNL